MPIEREAHSDLPAFFKFQAIGQGIAGRVDGGKTNDNGDFITLKPCIVRDDASARWERSEPYALGLSTDLSLKIDWRRDTGKYLVIEFVDTEPSRRGQPRKIFRVTEVTRDEIVKIRDGEMKLPDYVSKRRETATTTAQNDLDF